MKNILFNYILTVSLFFLVNMGYTQTQLDVDFTASYFGGTAGEYNDYIAIDASGNIILAGHTYSLNLPLKNAYQSTFKGGDPRADAFITKFTPDLSELIFSTYFGGTGYDEIKDVVVDSDGNCYITGLVISTDFPVTDDAFDKTYNGGDYDAFLAKFSPNGDLLYSTYFGGSDADYGFVMTIDDSANIYIAGKTISTDFPVKNAFSENYNNGDDIFLLKFNITNNNLIFSSYLGGSGNEYPRCLAVKKPGDIYLCGDTESSDFPVKNSVELNYQGNRDGFILKFSQNGQNLEWSTLIGGDENDVVSDIKVNSNDELYFIGSTKSTDLLCSDNAFSKVISGDFDGLIGIINSSGDSIHYLSYFGGNNTDIGQGNIHLLNDETIVLTGSTKSTDFPVSDNAYDKSPSNYDLFLSILNINTKDILYSSYFSGRSEDLLFDSSDLRDSILIVCGTSESIDFPTSSNVFMENRRGGSDEIIMKFKVQPYNSSSIQSKKNNPFHKIRN